MILNWIWRSKELTGPQFREINLSLQRRPMGSRPMDSTDLTNAIARKPYLRYKLPRQGSIPSFLRL